MRFPCLKQRNDLLILLNEIESEYYVVLKIVAIGNYPKVKKKYKKMENEKIKYSHFCIQLYDYTVVHHNRILTDIQFRN